MTEHRIIRHSNRSSRVRAAVLLVAAVCSTTVTCQLVIGDLPLREEHDAGGPSEIPDHSPADAIPQTDAKDVALEREGDTGDTGAEDAPPADADAPDVDETDAGPCVSDVPWYPDDDGDGYGRPDGMVMACPKPPGKWARATNDCNDANALVHPGQTGYFGIPFATGQTDSFDYDCSGTEDKNPAQSRFEGCSVLLDLAVCIGSGYERGPRSGIGVDPVCGSTTLATCQYKLAILLCEKLAQTVEEPYRCR